MQCTTGDLTPRKSHGSVEHGLLMVGQCGRTTRPSKKLDAWIEFRRVPDFSSSSSPYACHSEETGAITSYNENSLSRCSRRRDLRVVRVVMFVWPCCPCDQVGHGRTW